MMKNTKIFLVAVMAILGLNATAQDKRINATELPKNAQDFIEQHFKGNAINHAKIDQDGMRKTFEVKLTDGTEVEFRENGEWKEIDGNNRAIPSEFIAADIRSYLAKNYAGDKVTKISKGSREIEVELSNGTELEFDLAGKFLRIDK